MAKPGKATKTYDPDEVMVIGVDTNDKSTKDHPLWDERVKLPLNEAMVLNIMAVGVKVPIIVVEDEAGQPVVFDGRRRVLHAREANKRLVAEGKATINIPGMVEKGEAESKVEIGVSLNENRLDDTMLAKAIKAAQLRSYNKTPEEIAIIFGTSEPTVANLISLGNASKDLHSAVRDGIVGLTQAYNWSRKKKNEQVQLVREARVKAGEDPDEETRLKVALSAIAQAVQRAVKLGATEAALDAEVKDGIDRVNKAKQAAEAKAQKKIEREEAKAKKAEEKAAAEQARIAAELAGETVPKKRGKKKAEEAEATTEVTEAVATEAVATE